jgi:hypothetical protein
MTSREHARRLMLILLSSPGGPDRGTASDADRAGERSDDRQAGDGRDDSTDGDERTAEERFKALILT